MSFLLDGPASGARTETKTAEHLEMCSLVHMLKLGNLFSPNEMFLKKKKSAIFKIVRCALQSDSENFMHVSCLDIWWVTNFRKERLGNDIMYTFTENGSVCDQKNKSLSTAGKHHDAL